MRVLNLLNGPFGSQTGVEDGFLALQISRRVQAVKNIYYHVLWKEQGSSKTLNMIQEIAIAFKPDLIVFYHVDNVQIPREFCRLLKSLPSNPVLVCDEHDGYERFRKPLPKATRNVMAEAHIISLCGLGTMVNLIRKKDRHKIIYTPDHNSLERFCSHWVPTNTRTFDVVMIGNRITSRIPFKRISGAKKREELVRRLGEYFGLRFAVYGKGWDGFVGNRGRVKFNRQIETLRQSWISVGIEHCTGISHYFSDRLPIALSSGVAHVCHYRDGYSSLFEQDRDLVWFYRVDEAVEIIQETLSKGPEYLIELGAQGKRTSKEKFSPEKIFGDFIDAVKEKKEH